MSRILCLISILAAGCTGAVLNDVDQAATAPPPGDGSGANPPPAPPPIDITRIARRLQSHANTTPRNFELWHGVTLSPTEFWSGTRGAFHLTADDQIAQVGTHTGTAGVTICRYGQLFHGVPVENARYALVAVDSNVRYGQGRLASGLTVATVPTVDEASALPTALSAIGATEYRWQTAPQMYTSPHGQLVIYSPNFGAPTPFKLAWAFDVGAARPVWQSYRAHVDALTGALIDARPIDRFADSLASGTTVDGKAVMFYTQPVTSPSGFALHTTTATKINTLDGVIGHVTQDFIDADNSWTEVANRRGVSAHWAATATWNWLALRGRAGIDGLGQFGIGMTIIEANNADWCSTGTHYDTSDDTVYLCHDGGPGAPDVDVESVAHELGHAVVDQVIGEVRDDELAAINEHIGDVFGTSVNYSLYGDASDWLLFDKSATPTRTRNMANPKAQQNPDTYQGLYWAANYPEPHALAGVGNRWFYLLAMGGTGTNDFGTTYTVVGIGRGAAEKLVMRALYEIAGTGYTDYRKATLDQAIRDYGEASPEYAAVLEAWRAVGFDDPPPPSFRIPSDGQIGVSAWPVSVRVEVPLVACPAHTVCSPEISWQAQFSTDPNFTFPKTLDTGATRLEGGRVVAASSISLMSSQVYYWRVRARHGDGTWTPWGRTSAFETSAMAPTNASPNNGASSFYPWKTTFTWDVVPGATAYDLQIADDAGFSHPYVKTLNDSDATGIDLAPGKDYYWRVRARGPTGLNNGGWSTKYHGLGATSVKAEDLERPWESAIALKFHTATPVVHFVSPANAAYGGYPWPVTLTWEEVVGATSYEIDVADDDPTFATPYFHGIAANDTSIDVNVQPVANRKYYWRVRATAENDTVGGWSNRGDPSTQWFTTHPTDVAPTCTAPSSSVDQDPYQVHVRWAPVTNATSYHVEIMRLSDSVTVAEGDVAAPTTDFYVPNMLDFGTSYQTFVTSYGPDGIEGSFRNSSECQFTTKPLAACNTQATAGGNVVDVRGFELGKTSGTLRLHWRTFGIADKITISYQGATLWSNNCASTPDPANDATGPETITTIPFSGHATSIIVEVDPQCDGGGATTQWDYRIECP